MRFSRLIFSVAAAAGVAVATTSAICAEGDASKSKLPPGTGRLWNITKEPFTYQLATTSGSGWTAPITLAPGKYQELKMPPKGQITEIAGLHDPIPHVKIQFRQLGAIFRLSLPGRTPSDELVPQWFHVTDSNGFGRFVQARTLEEAQERQKEMQSRPKMTRQEIERTKEMLRANYVMFDDR